MNRIRRPRRPLYLRYRQQIFTILSSQLTIREYVLDGNILHGCQQDYVRIATRRDGAYQGIHVRMARRIDGRHFVGGLGWGAQLDREPHVIVHRALFDRVRDIAIVRYQ